MTKILVVGGGGREHAITWALAQSSDVREVIVAPGNAGIARIAPLDPEDVMAVVKFAGAQEADLVVIGPEVPLALGLVDALDAAGIKAFGPKQAAAQIESSKSFAKTFMQQHNIPTALYAEFQNYDAATRYVDEFNRTVVVKADGLAAGKGVIVCDDNQQARAALKQVLVDGDFGEAGRKVIIEERLTGPELSVLAFTDGKTIAMMPPSRDHKRAYDGDAGPNTGGMGAYVPVPDVDAALLDEIKRTVLQPAVDGLAALGTPYKGVLYAGLMLTADGPKTLEFNCRFGDPEAQAILPLLETDLLEIMHACVDGTLDQIEARWKDAACAAVVAASPGYPGDYTKGLPITLNQPELDDVLVFHAGTTHDADGRLVTSGGRVLAVSALGDDLEAAIENAYAGMKQICFDDMHYRRDIGR